MLTFRSVLRALVVASAFAVVAAPAASFAGEGRGNGAARAEGKHGGRDKHFPIAAEKFQKHVEKRIDKARAKLETHLKEKNVSADKRAEVLKAFDAGATEVRALAKRVGEDGTVTKDEAEQVRVLARSLKHKAREKLGHGGKKHDKQQR